MTSPESPALKPSRPRPIIKLDPQWKHRKSKLNHDEPILDHSALLIQIRPSSLVDGTKSMLSHPYSYLLPQFESLYYLFGRCTQFWSYRQTTCEQPNAPVVGVQLTVSLCSLSSLPLPPPTCTNLTMSSAVCPRPSAHSPPTDQFASLL